MFSSRNLRKLITLVAGLILVQRLSAQVPTEVPIEVPGAKPVSVERLHVHGTALEGNLEGDEADREVIVFLPPSYAKEKSRRYPVVYALHGYSIGAEQWTHEIHVPQTIEGAFARGAREMIVVLPDSKTFHNGSMYSSSPTTGDFEKFESWFSRPFHGRLRHHADRDEASGRVWQSIHHEPVLFVSATNWPPSRGR